MEKQSGTHSNECFAKWTGSLNSPKTRCKGCEYSTVERREGCFQTKAKELHHYHHRSDSKLLQREQGALLPADTLLSQTMCAHRPICQHTVAARIDYYCWRILGYPIKKQREGLCSTGCIIFFYVASLDRLSFTTAQYCTHTYRFKEILQKYLI